MGSRKIVAVLLAVAIARKALVDVVALEPVA